MGLFKKSCWTNDSITTEKLPNPNPSRWTLITKKIYPNGYVLKVKYHDCTNFEGIKIMVYEGDYKEQHYLDPHFSESNIAPVARFKPDKNGWKRANVLAQSF